MKKLTSILLCACLMLNFVIVGVLPVSAATDTRVEVVNQNFDDTSFFTPDHATLDNKSGYWSVSVTDGTRPVNKRDTYVPFNTNHLDGGAVSGGAYLVSTTDGAEQETDVAHSGTQAVKGLVSWRYDNGASYLTKDQIITVWHYVQYGQMSAFKIMNGNIPTFQVSMADGSADSRQLYVYDLDKVGGAGNVTSGLRFPTDTWVKITVVINSVTNEARVSLTPVNGSEQFAEKTYRLQGEVGTNVVTVGRDNVTYTDDLTVTTLDLSNDDYAYLFASNITFDAGDGTLSGDTAITTDGHGRLATLPTATLDGYTFDGWYTAEGVKVTTDTVFTEDTTVTAKYVSTITFVGGDGAEGTMAPQLIEKGTSASLSANAFTKTNNAFLGWATSSDRAAAGTVDHQNLASYKPTGNATLYAVWKGLADAAYKAGITSIDTSVTVDGTVSVTVTVSANEGNTGTAPTEYSAAELELAFSDSLAWAEGESGEDLSGAAAYLQADGTLKIVDNGVKEDIGNTYTIVFKALKQDDEASVALLSAAFGTKDEAATSNLNAALCDPNALTITVNNKSFTVTFPEGDIFTGDESGEVTKDYTFSRESATGEYYNYTFSSVTDNGVEIKDNGEKFIDNSDGTWTIKAVDGDIVITATRAAKTYSVTVTKNPDPFVNENDDAQNFAPGGTATYGEDYTFTLPANVEAGESEGYSYSVTNCNIDGWSLDSETRVVTLPGTNITKNIEITVRETKLDANIVSVTVTGVSGAATNVSDTANKNTSFTITLDGVEPGWKYTVTATMGDDNVELTEGTEDETGYTTYTVANVTGKLVFDIQRVVDTTNLTLSQAPYLSYNGGVSEYLLVLDIDKIEGKIITIDMDGSEEGSNAPVKMLWSEKYGTDGAYCLLVRTNSEDEITDAMFNIADGTTDSITYNCDVNMTGVEDANDAQLVYNMYSTAYAPDSANVTLEKLLKADLNGDGKVDTADAVYVVNVLLNKPQA